MSHLYAAGAVAPSVPRIADLASLLALAKALLTLTPLTDSERAVLADAGAPPQPQQLDQVRAAVIAGADPLGDTWCELHSPAARRGRGQTFTPVPLVEGMLAWALRQGRSVERVLDPGAGSGRFTLAALRAFPGARAVAIEQDPAVALLLRANLAAAGLADRAKVMVGDFRQVQLPRCEGTTLFIGNPPYVRHHDIEPEWKAWYSQSLMSAGRKGSQLAGLHLHFFVRTLQLAAPGDLGCFVTAAEWLDTGYGCPLRHLLTGALGGREVHVAASALKVFPDALASAAVTCFEPGSAPAPLCFSALASLDDLRVLARGLPVAQDIARAERKWSTLVAGGRRRPEGSIELGDLFKVSRGLGTGMNRVWVVPGEAPQPPARFLRPAVTAARDITGGLQATPAELQRLVLLPRDLADLSRAERTQLDAFLEWARGHGAHETYLARHRNPWWFIGRQEPAPILMTTMRRGSPVFVHNPHQVQHLNTALGLYPRQPVTPAQIERAVTWLNANVPPEAGRAYAGGLMKFEPSDAARIAVPQDLLA